MNIDAIVSAFLFWTGIRLGWAIGPESREQLVHLAGMLGIIGYCAWFWVLVYYWIDSPLPGWLMEGLK